MFNHDALRNILTIIGRDRLNSATKYPSIPTLHEMGEKGLLTDKLTDIGVGPFFFTEKIDGTNTRIIITPFGYILGSREHLIYAQGDIFGDPAMGIVSHVRDIAQKLWDKREGLDDTIITIYGETYGGKVTAGSKQYTGNGALGFRIFDLHNQKIDSIPKELNDIALHREARVGFSDSLGVANFCLETGIPSVPNLLPFTDNLKLSIEDAHDMLKLVIQTSQSVLDGGAGKKPEGVVISNRDRTKVAKLRFEDYERTYFKRLKIAA